MKLIDERLKELQVRVENLREMISIINKEIESGELVLSDSEQSVIDYTALQGRNALKEIKRLEELLR
jgi:hypothetical protein